MILLADSGSTKTDWVLLNKEKTQFSTLGFNPFIRDFEFITGEIKKNKKLLDIKNEVRQIYFYCAGCSSEKRKNSVKLALTSIFVKADIIVDHDLTACAHALYSGKPIIANILGTGTNTCYFDGKKITQQKPSLGYILGDEASGCYLGKNLITNYLYHDLPKELEQAFDKKYNLSKDNLLENVYMKPGANTYLASFAPFYSEHIVHEYIQQTLRNSFETFFNTHITCYDGYKELNVNFIGSIAFNFKEVLTSTANTLGITVGTVIKKPLEGLIEYHLTRKIH